MTLYERGTWPKIQEMHERKLKTLQVKFALGVNGVTEEIAALGMLLLFDRLDCNQRNSVRMNLSAHMRKDGCDKKDDDVPEEVTLSKTLHMKGTREDTAQH